MLMLKSIRASVWGLICLSWGFYSKAQNCTLSDGTGCKCTDTLQINCTLLPDMAVAKKILTDSGGFVEYPQFNAGENYGQQGADDGRFRLAVSITNIGRGPLHINTTNLFVCDTDTFTTYPGRCPDGLEPDQPVLQRIFRKEGDSITWYERWAGTTYYHPIHGHVHAEDIAMYSLRIKIPSEPDPHKWPLVGEMAKTGFCLYNFGTCSMFPGHCVNKNDSILLDNNFPNQTLGDYVWCSPAQQGISSGQVDIYEKDLYGMWIHIPPGTCNGSYELLVEVDPFNLYLESDETNNWITVPVTLTKQDAPGNPKVTIQANRPGTICRGDTVLLTATAANSYLWSTGDTTQTIAVTDSGSYTVTINSPCGITTSAPYPIYLLSAPSAPVVPGDTLCMGDSILLKSPNNDILSWYITPSGGNPVAKGISFQTPPLFNTVNYFAEATQASAGFSYTVGKSDTTAGGGKYSAGGKFLWFDCYSHCTLKSVTLFAKDTGISTILLRDEYGDDIEGRTISFLPGKNVISLGFKLHPEKNLQLFFSGTDDTLFMDSTGVQFPYTVPGVISITNSSISKKHYPFLYNWEIVTDSFICRSPRTLIPVVVDTSCQVGVREYAAARLPVVIYPQPAAGKIILKIPERNHADEFTFILSDITGRIILEENLTSLENAITLPVKKGLYLYRVFRNRSFFAAGKIIVEQ